jgi:hypothetical protein
MALWSDELTTGCFAKAKKDEPMFVLLSRDALAPWLVRGWACLRRCQIYLGVKPVSDFERCDEAVALAKQMRAWRKANWPQMPERAPVRWTEGEPSECDCQHPDATADGFAAVSISCPIHGDR